MASRSRDSSRSECVTVVQASTSGVSPVDPVATSPPETQGTSTRAWALHLCAVAIMLAAAFCWLAPRSIISADEGAVLAQARIIRESGTWGLPPDPSDPSGRWFALDGSVQARGRFYLFTKAPAVPLLVAGLEGVGGIPLTVGLQTLCVLLASLTTGLIAEHIRRGRGPAALWVTALGSPLIFDGYWLIPHAAGALCFSLAILGLLRWMSSRRLSGVFLALGALVIGATLRTEMALACAAIGLATLFAGPAGWRRRSGVASMCMAVGVASYVLNNTWQRMVEGGSTSPLYRPNYHGGWVEGRVEGALTTLLLPGTGATFSALLTALAATCCLGGTILLRRSGSSERGRILLAAGAVAAVVRLVFAPELVPGLVMAMPAILAWTILGTRHTVADRRMRWLLLTGGIFAGAVLATQYGGGAGGDWGGRYLHVAVPLVAVVAVAALSDRRELGGRDAVRVVLVTGVVVSLAFSVSALRVHDEFRRGPLRVVTATWSLAGTGASTATDPRPLVVSGWGPFGRFSHAKILTGRMLRVTDPSDLEELRNALRREGVRQLTVVVPPEANWLRIGLQRDFRVENAVDLTPSQWWIAALRRVND